MNPPKRNYLSSLLLFASFIGALCFTIVLYLDSEFPTFSEMRSVENNLGFFVLINLNLIAVLVLGFLVIKNIIKLVLDRRRNIFGSRLRTRLVFAFVALSLIPTVLLFLVAKGILGTVIQGWFSPQIVESVNGALDVGSYYYKTEESRVERWSKHVSETLSGKLFLFEQAPNIERVSAYLDRKRNEYGLFEISIVDALGRELYRSRDLKLEPHVGDVIGPNLESIREAIEKNSLVRPEQSLTAEFLRGYNRLDNSVAEQLLIRNQAPFVPVVAKGSSYVLITTLWIPSDLSEVLSSVVDAYDDYRELHTYRRPLVSSYILTLVVVTLLIVFAAIWVGFYLARGLSGPIQELAEGTQQVALGNLSYRLPEVGDDELSVLVKSFNTMTDDLRHTTGELVERRHYMETVLASVGIGVVSLNHAMRITTCNISASDMLSLGSPQTLLEKSVSDVFPYELYESLLELVETLKQGSEGFESKNATIEIDKRVKHLHLTLTKLLADGGELLGFVLLIDDITELVSAQRMAAWREVAKRIAHEIKNPLTPIQLSAQRLQRRFSQRKEAGIFGTVLFKESDREIIHDATSTIIKQVENLRGLVNEFSQFARMPKLNLKSSDINLLINETLGIYREAHPEISFSVIIDASIPTFSFDPEQLTRALINLIDNAVASVKSVIDSGAEGYEARIQVQSELIANLDLVSLKVADNGIGVSELDKTKLFEPYFSTKKGGTGLGLAIVSSIVADHNGFIRVKDNSPRGVVFVIELPISSKEASSQL